jgi:hypothetical protein
MIKVKLPVVELSDEQRLTLEHGNPEFIENIMAFDYVFYRIDCITTSDMFQDFTTLFCGDRSFEVPMKIEAVEKEIDAARRKFVAGMN